MPAYGEPRRKRGAAQDASDVRTAPPKPTTELRRAGRTEQDRPNAQAAGWRRASATSRTKQTPHRGTVPTGKLQRLEASAEPRRGRAKEATTTEIQAPKPTHLQRPQEPRSHGSRTGSGSPEVLPLANSNTKGAGPDGQVSQWQMGMFPEVSPPGEGAVPSRHRSASPGWGRSRPSPAAPPPRWAGPALPAEGWVGPAARGQ